MAEVVTVAEYTNNFHSVGSVDLLATQIGEIVKSNRDELYRRGLGGVVVRHTRGVDQTKGWLHAGERNPYLDSRILLDDYGNLSGMASGMRCGENIHPYEYTVRRLRAPVPPGIANFIPPFRVGYEYGYEVKAWSPNEEILAIGYKAIMEVWRSKVSPEVLHDDDYIVEAGVAWTSEILPKGQNQPDIHIDVAITASGLEPQIIGRVDDREISRRLFLGSRINPQSIRINPEAWHIPPRSQLYAPTHMHGHQISETTLVTGILQ